EFRANMPGDVDEQIRAGREVSQFLARQAGRRLAGVVELATMLQQVEAAHDVDEAPAVLALGVRAPASGGVHRPFGTDFFYEYDIVAEAAEAEDVLEPVPRAAGRGGGGG